MARNTIGFFNQLRTRQTAVVGEGTDVQRIENTVIVDYPLATRGLNLSVPEDRVPEGFVADIQNFAITDRDQLVRVPGIVADELLSGHPTQELFVLGNPATGLAELVMIDDEFLGVRLSDGTATTWTDMGYAVGPVGWASCVHGDIMILSNGGGTATQYKQPLATATIPLSWGPARALMSFAGRVFAGGVTDGSYIPMGILWTGSTSEPDDLGPGSGFEELFDDTANGDQIVAMRSLGFDIAAIITRNALWVARRTGDANRPADFSPVAVGFGGISHAATVRVPAGVAYLSQSDVIVFDGNVPQSISVPINSAIFPLDTNRLEEYCLNYSESRNVLQVLTPVGLFEYSFRFNRWLKNTVTALRVVNTGTEFETLGGGGVIGEGEEGGWGFDWGFSWGETSMGGGAGAGAARPLDTAVYLKTGEAGGALGVEDVDALTFFGVPFTPSVTLPVQQAQSTDMIVSCRRIIVGYQGAGGALQFYVPDADRAWVPAREIELAASSRSRTRSLSVRQAGKMLGVRIDMELGSVVLERVQAEVEMRSLDRLGASR